MKKGKAFLVQCRALEERLEPIYHLPKIVRLENQIRKVAHGILKDYILSVSSGATPSMNQISKYYSDAENGIPFLRVQNLSVSGELVLDNVKYINIETHENLLKRSQVGENDLLIKITGVGRMAIASVPPKGFIGNTNQHIAVIKTKDRKTSKALAAYLNTNIAEKLATRRATGGTRPALDYKALKSIPIVFNEAIAVIMQDAYKIKKEKQDERKKLLASIDAYLLNVLGIELPKKRKRVMCFETIGETVNGSRFDPFYHQKEFDFYKNPTSNYPVIKIKDISKSIQTGLPIRKDFRVKNGQYPYFGANGIIGYMQKYTHDGKYLIVAQDGYIGNHYVINGKFWASNHNWVLKLDETKVNFDYLKYILDITNYKYLVTGGVIPKLTKSSLKKIKIPLPPLSEQEKIASHISSLREQAKLLQAAASKALEEAKAEVEKMILGKSKEKDNG
ncbi:MAG: restriction endonuclease subunit S [Chitinophagales bacterium]